MWILRTTETEAATAATVVAAMARKKKKKKKKKRPEAMTSYSRYLENKPQVLQGCICPEVARWPWRCKPG